MALSLLTRHGVQIQLTSDPLSGHGAPASQEGSGRDGFYGEKELLDDFLSRLQSIIRRSPASTPSSLDDTRPSGLARARS
jgi:hypothetical protein